MNTLNNITEEDYSQSLLKCDKIDQIVPDIFYNVRLLQQLDKRFENDPSLKQVEFLLLKLPELFEIREDEATYVNQYRHNLVQVLTVLGEFIFELSDTITLDDKENIKLLKITQNLNEAQQAILEIID
ncbi:hypothetical protein [Legionella fairfieldensis]|uniref:hypothetical protein n=1 Tax=Legionella fairfieldensis TaxID=45064 RepID=UPI000490DC63|nr:hypothetical protein [Legionella fairfieldensis]